MAFNQGYIDFSTFGYQGNPLFVLNTNVQSVEVLNPAGPPPFMTVATLVTGVQARADFPTLAQAKTFYENGP